MKKKEVNYKKKLKTLIELLYDYDFLSPIMATLRLQIFKNTEEEQRWLELDGDSAFKYCIFRHKEGGENETHHLFGFDNLELKSPFTYKEVYESVLKRLDEEIEYDNNERKIFNKSIKELSKKKRNKHAYN